MSCGGTTGDTGLEHKQHRRRGKEVVQDEGSISDGDESDEVGTESQSEGDDAEDDVQHEDIVGDEGLHSYGLIDEDEEIEEDDSDAESDYEPGSESDEPSSDGCIESRTKHNEDRPASKRGRRK